MSKLWRHLDLSPRNINNTIKTALQPPCKIMKILNALQVVRSRVHSYVVWPDKVPQKLYILVF